MEQIKPDAESCSSTVGELIEVAEVEFDLKSWSASSMDEFKAVKIGRECKLSTWPNWRCTICNKAIIHGEVYQCEQGHLACQMCSRSGECCKTCSKAAVSHIRNLVVEEMLKSGVVVTCKYVTLGCTQVIKFNELPYSCHEKLCSFTPMICPMLGCHQAGVKNLFTNHVLTDHTDISLMVDLERSGFMWVSKVLELDSSTKLVLLREIGNEMYTPVPTEFHLLHQESTRSDDIFKLTSLTRCSKRAFDLEIKTNLTYSVRGRFDRVQEEEPILLIPKQVGAHPLKKECIIRTYRPDYISHCRRLMNS